MKLRTAALIAALAMPAFAGGAHAATVKVGVIAPFSGGFAIWGQQFQEAIEAYQAVHGTSVGDTEIEVVYRDVGGPDPAKAKQLAEELVLREGVQYLAGFAFTPNALAVADIASEADVPVLLFNAATASLTRESPMYVRLSMTLPQQTAPVAEWAATHGYGRVSTVVSDYAPGIDAETQFLKSYQAAGGTIVSSQRVPLSTTDFAPFLEKVLQEKPDAMFIFMPAGPPSISTIATWSQRGLKDAGIELMGTGETQELYLPAIGPSAIGAISGNQYGTELDTPVNAVFLKALHDVNPDAIPDSGSVAAWDGMQLIYDALAELGPEATGSAVVDFMKGRTIDSPRGSVSIDPETRDIVQDIYIRRVVAKGERLVNEVIDVVRAVKDPWKQDNPL
jgi:branched-chain amino acid transport system substrate-binding protein